MASIIKIGQRWRALIRRRGHKSICKTFPTKAAAESWARAIESQLEQGQPVVDTGLTVARMIQRYRELRDKTRPILDTSNEHYVLKHLFGVMPVIRQKSFAWIVARSTGTLFPLVKYRASSFSASRCVACSPHHSTCSASPNSSRRTNRQAQGPSCFKGQSAIIVLRGYLPPNPAVQRTPCRRR